MEDFTGVVTLILAICFILWFVISRHGSGRVASEARHLENFEQLELTSRGTVILERGDQDTVTIEAEDNLLPKISSEVFNHTLSLGFKWSLFPFFWPTKPLVYRLVYRDLRSVTVADTGKIEGASLVFGQLEITARGSGHVQLDDMQTDLLKVTVSGSGRVTLSGRAREQEIIVRGSGNYLGDQLLSQEARIRLNGSGQVLVDAGERLDVTIVGRGVVKYAGTPALRQNITGTGRLIKFGEG
jgi:hypothetical protein